MFEESMSGHARGKLVLLIADEDQDKHEGKEDRDV